MESNSLGQERNVKKYNNKYYYDIEGNKLEKDLSSEYLDVLNIKNSLQNH